MNTVSPDVLRTALPRYSPLNPGLWDIQNVWQCYVSIQRRSFRNHQLFLCAVLEGGVKVSRVVRTTEIVLSNLLNMHICAGSNNVHFHISWCSGRIASQPSKHPRVLSITMDSILELLPSWMWSELNTDNIIMFDHINSAKEISDGRSIISVEWCFLDDQYSRDCGMIFWQGSKKIYALKMWVCGDDGNLIRHA